MAKYRYKATDRSGKHVTGIIDAANESGVVQRLRDQNLLPLSISPEKGKDVSLSFDFRKLFQRVRHKDVMDFTSKLSILMDSGVQLDRALAISMDLTDNPKMKDVIHSIRRKVQGGASFADALGSHPKIFNRLYVNMVRSGEASGVLETILQRLAGFLENAHEIRSEVISASIYPALLIVVGSLLVFFMVSYVLPKFVVIFVNMGADLPFPTKILVSVTNIFRSYWYFLLGALTLVVVGIKQYLKTEEGNKKWDAFKLKMPLLGDLFLKMEVARFSRTLGTLVRSGVPILQALSIVRETLTNNVISRALLDVYGCLKEGGGLAAPMKETGCFPPLAVHMIAVGEETGSFEAMLIRVADTYENEVRTTVNRVMTLLEPTLILVMGGLIGFIVIAMLMAVFSVSDMPI